MLESFEEEFFNEVGQYQNKLSKIYDIPVFELIKLLPFIKKVQLEAKETFIYPGDDSDKIAFITKGLTKTFYTSEDGIEYISHFAAEGSFTGLYTDILLGEKASGKIEAIEHSTLYVLSYSHLISLSKEGENDGE